jgi:hypothetical protein
MRSARVGYRFEQPGKTLQGSFGQQALGLLFAERRQNALAWDTIHERRLLERRVGLLSLSYLSCEAPLSNTSQALKLIAIDVLQQMVSEFFTWRFSASFS